MGKYSYIILLIFTLNLGSCVPSNQKDTGFFYHRTDVSPLKGVIYKENRPPIKMKNPKESTVVIYAHGSSSSNTLTSCERHPIPDSFMLILKSNPHFHVYYLCSKVVNIMRPGMNYMQLRKHEVLETAREFIKLGVNPKNIFLAGQSSGGAISLLAMEHVNKLFNAAIITAPSAGGRRASINVYGINRRKLFIQRVTNFKRVEALVFAYHNDSWNRPQDLTFLTDAFPETIKMVAYQCDIREGHFTATRDCRAEENKRIIENYILEQKAGFPN